MGILPNQRLQGAGEIFVAKRNDNGSLRILEKIGNLKSIEIFDESERLKAISAAAIDSIPDEARKEQVEGLSSKMLDAWSNE